MTPYLHAVSALVPILLWAGMLLFVMTSLCSAVVALRYPQRPLVYVSAAALAVALVLAGIPTPHAPPGLGVLLTIAALALAVVGGGPAAMLTLALASRGNVPAAGIHGGIVLESRSENAPTVRWEVLRGGTAIGYLERLAAAGVIVAGFPAAIALVVAIKSVGRFSELNVAESTERFIIGTFVSLIWACACAGVVHLALH